MTECKHKNTTEHPTFYLNFPLATCDDCGKLVKADINTKKIKSNHYEYIEDRGEK